MDQLAKDRQKFLLGELSRVQVSYKNAMPPERVKRARHIVAEYERMVTRERERKRKRLEVLKTRIRHEIYFGSQVIAAKLLQKLKQEFD